MAINKKLKYTGIGANINTPSCVGEVFLLDEINKTPVVFKKPTIDITDNKSKYHK